jgi:hypothetical protein
VFGGASSGPGLRGEEVVDVVMIRGRERGVRGEKGEGMMERREGLKGVAWIWRGGLDRSNMLEICNYMMCTLRG